MLTKLLVASIVFLEILKVPNAEGLVTNWSLSVFKRPIIQQDKTLEDKNTFNNIDLDKIPLPPIRKQNATNPYVSTYGVLLMDMDTSKILYQKNQDKKYSLASLTKIMTAIIALENYQLKDVVVVPKESTQMIGSKINLKPDEKLTVESLLYGLLLYSGNDAAYTLASKIGIDNFVRKMNKKAKDLGLNDMHFVDPAGLQADNTTSLHDLAFLAKYALQNPKFAQIVKTESIEISSIDGAIRHPLKNTNKLLRDYPGTFGVKTGYTEEAGHCLISAVEREGHRVLAVVLHHPSDQFKESMQLFDWVFKSYVWQ